MRIMASKLLGRSIYDINQDEIVGKIRKVLVDPDSGRFMSISVDKAMNKLISSTELIWSNQLNSFYVNDDNPICERHELVRTAQLIEDGRFFNAQKVDAVDGDHMGFLFDFELDIDLGILTQIVVRKKMMFFHIDKIIPRSNIIEVEADRIRVRDNEAFAMQNKRAETASVPTLQEA